MKTIKQAREYFQRQLASAQNNLDKFAQELQKNPLHAMEWSQSAFGDAAWATLSRDALKMLEGVEVEDRNIEELAEHLKSQAMREVRFPSRSTNVTSNLAAQERARVFLEAAEYLAEYY